MKSSFTVIFAYYSGIFGVPLRTLNNKFSHKHSTQIDIKENKIGGITHNNNIIIKQNNQLWMW